MCFLPVDAVNTKHLSKSNFVLTYSVYADSYQPPNYHFVQCFKSNVILMSLDVIDFYTVFMQIIKRNF